MGRHALRHGASAVLFRRACDIPTRRWGLAFAAVAVVLILILFMWLNWYASGHVVDLT